jgi:UDP-N-acetylmuramate--alanine ligase
LILCGDASGYENILAFAEKSGVEVLTYGKDNPENKFQAINLTPNIERGGYDFDASFQDECINVSLQIPGTHNVLNAMAALVVFDLLGLELESSVRVLNEFMGTERRFEIMGDVGGVTVISDYAHHPTEIKATLAATRSRYPGRDIWAVWQPHTYSRTKLLLPRFLESFADADFVLVMDVYPAREPIDEDFSGVQIVKAMNHPNTHYVPDIQDAVETLTARLQNGDILIVMTAGDADILCSQVLNKIAGR